MAAAGRHAGSLFRRVCGGLRCVTAEGSQIATKYPHSLNVVARASTSKGEDVVKAVFVDQQQKFRAFIAELSKSKMDLDPNNESSLKTYFNTLNKIREKLGVSSFTVKIADLLESAADDAPDVRTFLEIYRNLRHEVGIEDDMGADKLTFAALAKVEKQIGKRLTKDDANGMSLMKKEIDQINKTLGLADDMLEKMEEEAEWALAKAELQEYMAVATDKIDTYKRRDDLKVDVNLKELDYRNYL